MASLCEYLAEQVYGGECRHDLRLEGTQMVLLEIPAHVIAPLRLRCFPARAQSFQGEAQLAGSGAKVHDVAFRLRSYIPVR